MQELRAVSKGCQETEVSAIGGSVWESTGCWPRALGTDIFSGTLDFSVDAGSFMYGGGEADENF